MPHQGSGDVPLVYKGHKIFLEKYRRVMNAEKYLMEKWSGKDFLDEDEFWADVLKVYGPISAYIPMPYKFTPATVRMVHDRLDCKPGICGKCCNYKFVPVGPLDIKRITDNVPGAAEVLQKYVYVEGGASRLNTSGGCPFLEENVCTIWPYRPDVCWQFPVQKGQTDTERLKITALCAPALAVIRSILIEAQSMDKDLVVYPNLTFQRRQ